MDAKPAAKSRSLFTILGIALLASCKFCEAQGTAAGNAYKPLTDRLESIVTMPLDEWRYHADVAHPEESSLEDKAWPAVKAGETWKTGRSPAAADRIACVVERVQPAGSARSARPCGGQQ